MKKEQSVYNKLHKFSAKESVAEPIKVEFAVVDNIKSASAKLEKANSAIDGTFSKGSQKIVAILADSKKKIGDVIDSLDIALDNYDEDSMPLYESLTAFEKAVKELGMNPFDNPIYKQGVGVNDDYSSYRKYYEGEVKKLNALYNSLKTSI